MKVVVAMVVALLTAAPAWAQDETQVQAEFRKEQEALKKSCGGFDMGAVPGCAVTLATASPVHLTFGSIAPQNGVAFGPALVGHATPSNNWRINWSGDVVVAPGGAWRAGAYAKFVRTDVRAPGVSFGGAVPRPTGTLDDAYPVYSAFWQTASLDKLFYFGAGGVPPEDGPAIWTMKQTIVGGSAQVPIKRAGRLGLSATGAVNTRMIQVGPAPETVSDPLFASAVPGLIDDRTFVQFSEGLRIRPSIGAHVKPMYTVGFDQFVSSDNASFNRWTVDLVNEFPFYRTQQPRSTRDFNTPNDCAISPTDSGCPSVTSEASASRNRYGALTFRVLTTGTPGDDPVPYYLQPTVGGSDINGAKLLTSFQDYRFRAPNVFMLQLAIEHTLFEIKFPRNITIPLGAFVMAEQGKAAQQWDDLFSSLQHSYATGLTIRAGGFPEVFLLFAWGHEGHHFSGTINPSLLGGAPRPLLY